MASLNELGPTRQIHDVLAAGIDVLSGSQEVMFRPYVAQVLPADGYRFWVNASILSSAQLALAGLSSPNPVSIQGSLHYASRGEQAYDETIVIARVHFATPATQGIRALGELARRVLWIGSWKTEFGPITFAFSERGSYYEEAGISHFVGDAVYPAFLSQLIDTPAAFDTRQVVSNSLPIWLKMLRDPPFPPLLEWVPPANFMFHPAELVSDNLAPPYGVVDIRSTRTFQAAPTFGPRSEHDQLCADDVLLTFYGLRNDEALSFQEYIQNYSLWTDEIGIMNMPVMYDERRKQTELAVIAQKKTMNVEVSYQQRVVRDLARQYIKKSFATFYHEPSTPPPTASPPIPLPPIAQPVIQPFYLSFGTSGSFSDLIVSEYDGNYVLFDYTMPVNISLPVNLTTSPIPTCAVASVAPVTLILQWIPFGGTPTQIITVNYPAGSLVGSYSSLMAWNISIGDRLRLMAPAAVDKTIAEVSGTIVASRFSTSQ